MKRFFNIVFYFQLLDCIYILHILVSVSACMDTSTFNDQDSTYPFTYCVKYI